MRRTFHLVEPIVSGVGVLDKAVAVINACRAEPRSLGDLVAATGLARATAFRLAQALEVHGLLRRDSAGRFTLGLGLVALGREAAGRFPLVEAAGPVLAALRDRTGESVQLYLRDGDVRRCIVALDSPHELRTIVAVGAVLPLGRGSAGRLLAGDPPTRGGWLETVEDRESGVASVSAAVRGLDGVPVAAVCVSGPIDRIGRSPGRRHGSVVVDAARELDGRLPR